MNGVQSFRNKYLVKLLHKLGYIENYSSGLNRIFKEYKKNKEQPLVQTSLNMFKVTFPDLNYKFIIDISESQNGTLNGTLNGTQEITQEITQENIYVLILEIIEINPKVTRREIANKLSLSPDKIKYQLDKMKKSGIIKHEGPTKTGYWKIIRYSIK